ncbi:MAG: AAC(3)-I family aminoglycoside N-acetyltransferase [Ectothiorhodospiraceae bacterium]|nr:AAC(3)-I family aminoglycoside N-acetyltransferase [Chromatiales bacterium]MCP5154160.1 AAC(3)-I family aminoglycoside N-acetyltransferase [Ectothiorhodospiraceae bacterium]
MQTIGGLEVSALGPGDVPAMRALTRVLGEAFEDLETYARAPASDAYLERILARDELVVLAATKDGEIVGGLVAYELVKIERERSEIYIYDLAVAAAHRRQGVATALIREAQRIAAARGAWVVYVQADLGDAPAIALYTKLGVREDVLHFDIPVR